jgi:tetratricopeptide (TPR) repeat protein
MTQFRLLGFEWLVNLIPFGGLTLAGSLPKHHSRRNALLFVAGGPLVNIVAAIWAWTKIGNGELLSTVFAFPTLFFWANSFLLLFNLIPRTVSTPFGRFDNDGKLLFRLLFSRANSAISTESERLHRKAALLRLEKAIVLAILVIFIVLAVSIAILFTFVLHGKEFSPSSRLFFGVFFSILAVVLGILCIRHARVPVDKMHRSTYVERLAARAAKELKAASECLKDPRIHEAIRNHQMDTSRPHWTESALELHPNDSFALFVRGTWHYAEGRYSQAEKMYDFAIANSRNLSQSVYGQLLAGKLQCLVRQNDISKAHQLCTEYLAGTASVRDKVDVIDHWACTALMSQPPVFLDEAGSWIAKALELLPGIPTLSGTLGGIRAEQGRYSEAEPLLRDCLERSSNLADQGISLLYLGLIETHRGDPKKAAKLLRRARAFHPSEWLLKKSDRLLNKLRTDTTQQHRCNFDP